MYRNICLRSLPLKQLELEISQTLLYSLRKYTHKTDSLLQSVTSIKKTISISFVRNCKNMPRDYNVQNFVSQIRKVVVYDLPSLFLCFLSPPPTTAYSNKIGAVKQAAEFSLFLHQWLPLLRTPWIRASSTHKYKDTEGDQWCIT